MLGPAPHRASPRFGRAPASPGMPVAAEQSRRDRSASRSSRGARRRVRAGAGREPRQRRRSTVAFKRRGLPGLGLPLSLPDSLRRPLPSLAVTIPPAWRSPSACPAAVSAGTARPHLSPVAGPLRPADRQRAGRALQDPTPSDSADPALPPSLGALGTPARRRGAALAGSRLRRPRFSHARAPPVLPLLCDHVRSLRRVSPRPGGLHLPNGESPLSRAARARLGVLPLGRRPGGPHREWRGFTGPGTEGGTGFCFRCSALPEDRLSLDAALLIESLLALSPNVSETTVCSLR